MKSKKWVRTCQKLRDRVVQEQDGEKKYLLANFAGTEQQKDIEKRTALINDFFRIKLNIKAFSDSEEQRRGIAKVDFSDNQQVFNAMAKEFDMSYWAFNSMPNKQPLASYNPIFIWQLKSCNMHCPWCYVDDLNKNSRQGNNSEFFSIREIIDVFEEQRKSQPLFIARPSGGEPTLAIEQWLETLQELEKRGLDREVYVRGDTNLSTGRFIEYLETTGQIEKNYLEKVAEYPNFGLLCSFKGTDRKSFLHASGMREEYGFLEQERWDSFEKIIKAGIDAYPFIYDPNPETLESFMKQGASRFGDGFYLKTWIFPLKLYGPEKQRLEKLGIDPEQEQERLDKNFGKSQPIIQNMIWNKFGLNYQAVPRTGIKLKVRDK